MTTRALLLLIVFGLTTIAAGCGDDSGNSPSDAGASGKGGNGGKGGSGGKGGADSNAGNGGSASGSGGKGGAGGAGGADAGNVDDVCTEVPSSTPITCGGQTCATPEFANNMCIVSCCLQVNGQATCGARSTSFTYPAGCTLPASPDPSCPAVGELQGCCNHDLGKCGIISSRRPGCIVASPDVDIPDKACTKTTNDTDAGPSDTDAGH